MFPKSRPIHDLWPADFFGQMHQVESEESHFILQPPNSALSNISYRRESASAIKEKVVSPFLSFTLLIDEHLNAKEFWCCKLKSVVI